MSKSVFCCGNEPLLVDSFVGSSICRVPWVASNLLNRTTATKQSNRVSAKIRLTLVRSAFIAPPSQLITSALCTGYDVQTPISIDVS